MVAPDRRNVTSSEVHSLFETNLILSQELLGNIDIRFLSANVPDGEQITMQTVDWLGELLWVHLYPLGADIGGRRTAYETLGTADQLNNSSVTKEMQGLSLK